ncbi:MAG TPA: acyl-CoA dehydrogenase family protein [Acidimicrobiales bacterium]|nr:acyl-CoA dehydrogenase family protein [Acidimicrobiales bacterium]
MNLAFDPADEAFRAELLAFLDEHAPPEARRGRDWIGDDDDTDEHGVMVLPDWARRWQATLFDAGWMVPGYPPELGGRNATPTQTLIFLEEMARLGVPRSLHFGGYAIVGPSLLEFGDEEQKALAPAAIRGDTVWCVGMSEPDAGSDLANLSTRAVDDGDAFVVNGQKVWTSYAMVASKCFCYVRTDTEVPKHKGISVLIVDMDSPGVSVRPLHQISYRAEFAEVFFTDVVVPKANLVGALNDGWRITMGSLAHERGALWVEGVAIAQRGIDDLVAMACERGLGDDPVVRRHLAELAAEVRSLRALGYKGFASFAQGSSAPQHSFMKFATAELRQRIYELAVDIQGPGRAVTDPELVPQRARWQKSWMTSLASTIGGGTSNIQRNVVATRVLGLPRD